MNGLFVEVQHLIALEEYGYMDTRTGQINRVAYYLAKNSGKVINDEEFRLACYACNVDPNMFTHEELNQLEKKLNQI